MTTSIQIRLNRIKRIRKETLDLLVDLHLITVLMAEMHPTTIECVLGGSINEI